MEFLIRMSLTKLWIRRIGYIGHSTVSQQRREKSLLSALADRGLAARKECFFRIQSLEKDTPRAVKAVLSLPLASVPHRAGRRG